MYSLFFTVVCVYVVSMCVHMCAYVCVQMHMETGSQLTLGAFVLYLMCLRLGLLLNLEHADWLDCWPMNCRDPPVCPPRVLDRTHYHICVVVWMLGTNSGACAVP